MLSVKGKPHEGYCKIKEPSSVGLGASASRKAKKSKLASGNMSNAAKSGEIGPGRGKSMGPMEHSATRIRLHYESTLTAADEFQQCIYNWVRHMNNSQGSCRSHVCIMKNALNITSSNDPSGRIKCLFSGERRERHARTLVSALAASVVYIRSSALLPGDNAWSIPRVRPMSSA